MRVPSVDRYAVTLVASMRSGVSKHVSSSRRDHKGTRCQYVTSRGLYAFQDSMWTTTFTQPVVYKNVWFKSKYISGLKLNKGQLPPLFHGELTSGSWTATRPRALRWGSGRSGPGSLSSTHACSPRCRTRRGAGRSLRPPLPLESAGPRSGTSWAAEERD